MLAARKALRTSESENSPDNPNLTPAHDGASFPATIFPSAKCLLTEVYSGEKPILA